MAGTPPRVAIVGGGIAGLATAHDLLTTVSDTDPKPTVVIFEAAATVGGKLQASPFAGHPAIDEGADAFLARVPWATALAQRVGLGNELVSPAAGTAAVWWNGLHRIPEGLLLGMPTDVVALARSNLMTWRGKLRAATEPLRRRTSLEPDSLGGFVRARFGDEVHLRLVDPLVGSIYAADTDHFSLAAVPQIADLAGKGRSVLVTARSAAAPPPNAGPVFYAPRDGMGALASHTATMVAAAGADVRTDTAVAAVHADGDGWTVNDERFDAVVFACPPAAVARVLTEVAPDAEGALRTIPSADVAMVTLAVTATDWPRALHAMSGYLVPKPMQRLVTAASFGSQKWAHWAVPGMVVLRISLGRDGLPVLHLSDEQLLAAAIDEVGTHLGITLQPAHSRVTRWPGAFPQYRPHHGDLVADIERRLPSGLTLAGAGYHGIGVPACVRSAERAAEATRIRLRARWHTREMRRRVAALAAVAVLLAACGDDRDGADSAGTVAATVVSTDAPTTTLKPTTTTAKPTTTLPATTTTTEPLPVPLPPPEPRADEPRIELGTIEIPKLGIVKPLFEGITLNTLDLGPGHWPGTAMPGRLGNVVIGGHRTSHDRPFRHVDQLVGGDEVVFTTPEGRFVYLVTSVEVVTPDAIRIIDQTRAHTATLFACHPVGSTKERIVVHLSLSGT